MDLNLLVILLASLARSVRSGGEGSRGWRAREGSPTELSRERRVTREARKEVETMFGCAGDSVLLSCQGKAGSIKIVRANYGRFSVSVCNPLARGDLDTSCSSEAATSVLLARSCQGRLECKVEVREDQLPPVCPATEKYLEVQYTCVEASMTSGSEAREPHLSEPLSSMWSNENHLEHHLSPHLLHSVVNQGVPITEGPHQPTTSPVTTSTTTTTIATTTTTTTRCVTTTTTTSSFITSIGWRKEAAGLREEDRSLLSVGEEESSQLWQRRLTPIESGGGDPGVSWDLVVTVIASSVSIIFLLFTIAVIVRQRLRKRVRMQVEPTDLQLTPSSSSVTSSPPGESVASFQQRFSHFQPELLHHRPENEEGRAEELAAGEARRRLAGGAGHFDHRPPARPGSRVDEVALGTSRELLEGGEVGGGIPSVGGGGPVGGCLCGVAVHYSISYTAPIPSPVSSSAATPVGLLQISTEPGDPQKFVGEASGVVQEVREGYRDLVRGHRSGRNSLVCDV